MKIACIDNMNNMMFSLVRYLRDLGQDADLFIRSDGYSHFSPESDSYTIKTAEFIRREEKKFYLYTKRELLNIYGKYDVIIGSGYAPFQLQVIGRSLDAFVPHGSDFFSYPLKPFGVTPRRLFVYALGRVQKAGIEKARYVHMDYTNLEQEGLISSFNLSGQRIRKPVPFIYYPQYETIEFEKFKQASPNYQSLKRLREESQLLLFHHSSHQWVNPAYSLSQKRNDVLIRGFAEFVRRNPGYKTSLVMVEYGPDVHESKNLIRELGLEARCVWIPLTTRKEIMSFLSLADIGAGEFGHSWFTYGTILEYMAMAVPVMHFREDALYASRPEPLYGMYNAKSSEEVTIVLERFKDDPESFKRTGLKSRDWFKRYVIEEPLRFYRECIL